MKSNCLKCNVETNQDVLYEEIVEYCEDGNQWWEEYKYQIIKCKGCDTISFRKLYNDACNQDSFDRYCEYHPDMDTDGLWNQELFPKRTLQPKGKYFIENLPDLLKPIYRETVEAYFNNYSILCSVGLRALVEGICKDKNVLFGNVVDKNGKDNKSHNLDGKIQELANKGILAISHAETLHSIRFMGNEAIHNLYESKDDELKLAFEIIYQTLKNLYEISYLSEKLKASRSK